MIDVDVYLKSGKSFRVTLSMPKSEFNKLMIDAYSDNAPFICINPLNGPDLWVNKGQIEMVTIK